MASLMLTPHSALELTQQVQLPPTFQQAGQTLPAPPHTFQPS